MAVSLSPSRSSNMDIKLVLSSSNPYSSSLAMARVYNFTEIEPLPYQFEPEASPDGDFPVDKPTEMPDNSSINRIGNVDW